MSIEAKRDVFQAIAYPTRRQIIHLIELGQEATYYSVTESIQLGFGGTFDKLEEHLKTAQGNN